MKKSKHFRKDVIMARVIAAVLVIVLIALIVFAVSLLSKPSGKDKNTESTQSTQSTQDTQQEVPDVDFSTEQDVEVEVGTEAETEVGTEEVSEDKVYVTPTVQVKLRKEPNTECATLDRIDAGIKLEVLETLEGWYKVVHNGQVGYVSATYVEIVEE